MNVIPAAKYELAVEAISSGLSIRRAAFFAGISKATVRKIIREGASKRVREGVNLCTRPSKERKPGKYKILAQQLESLPLHGEIYLPHMPNGEADTAKLRNRLMNVTPVRFSIRSQSNGLKLIRVGSYECRLLGMPGEFSPTSERVMVSSTAFRSTGSKRELATGAYFLGFMCNWDTLPAARVAKCSERACPYPSIGSGLCRQHCRQWGISPDRGDIAPRDIFSDDGFAPLSTHWRGQERTIFLRCFVAMAQGAQLRERDNDRWWKENVIDKGIIVSGVICLESASVAV